MKEVMYKTRDLLERKIDEVVSTGNISSNELECVYKAVKTIAQITTIEAMERGQWTDERSGRMDPYWHDESWRRGRNALGQYTSRGMEPMMDYDHGYSGHSVNDMMIQSLERTITPDMTEVERQRIYDQIRQIRERKD